MARLAEGFYFRELVEHDSHFFVRISVASGDFPVQKSIVIELPYRLCDIDWQTIVQWHFCGDDIEGNGYAVNFKRIHREVPLLTASFVKYEGPYLSAIFADVAWMLGGKPRTSVS